LATLILLAAMFVLLWALLIRPQRQRQQKHQQLLGSVAPGDEILTVGGLYGIVQEIDDEDDLIVEIADGIHVRIARRALATVIKPDDDDADEDEDDDEGDDDEDDVVDGEAELVDDQAELPGGVEEVNDEVETVNPGAAEDAAPPERS
jgi:preprotein translocase subunit YajC